MSHNSMMTNTLPLGSESKQREKVAEIPEYGHRIPQTFGQAPLMQGPFTDSSKMSSPNKAELLYNEAYGIPAAIQTSGRKASAHSH